jgi:hypothetical protein
MRIAATIVACVGLLACGGGSSNTDAVGGCTTGVACGSGCCANSTEACVMEGGGSAMCVPGCTRASDCSTGCCAPVADATGNLVGPYVCEDTAQCCFATMCTGSTCCVTDENNNEFCAEPCTGSGTCGGSSSCNAYVFENTTCTGTMACGPAM